MRTRTPQRAPEVQKQINKRMILNMLIQGAGCSGGENCVEMVVDELSELSPKLPKLYRQIGGNAIRRLLEHFAGLSLRLSEIVLAQAFP